MAVPLLTLVVPIRTPHGVVWARNHHSEGLSRAYSSPQGLYRDGNILYIAGTRSFADVMDDMRIPLNDTVHTQRYRDAVPMMNGVDVVVGHSLGGAVALSLSQQFRVHPITYAAPVFDLNPFNPQGQDRYRNAGDPVAFLDLAARTSLPSSLNVHSYE